MKTTTSFSNRLDDSNGSIKVTHNNAMQSASPTTESPETAKKGLLNRIGLLAILTVGAAAASFLKSKMEKAAAVASKVGAAILKSKKTVSAVLVGLLPEPPKKARLASASLLALLAGIFAAQNQGMATPRGTWLPEYEEHYYNKITHILADIPFLGQRRVPTVEPWIARHSLYSEYVEPSSTGIQGIATEHYYRAVGLLLKRAVSTTHFLTKSGLKFTVTSTSYFSGLGKQRTVFGGNTVNLVYHTKVGKETTIITNRLSKDKYIEKWKNKVFFHKTQRMDGGPFEFSVHFGARNDFIPSDDLNCSGYCEAGRISAYPGPATSVSPCVPSNMSMPRNGYLEFHYWDQLVRPSDDDDE